MAKLSNGDQVLTLEGLTQGGAGPSATTAADWNTPGKAFEIAFVEQQPAQCGYCANAMIMGAAGWLQERVSQGIASEDEIKCCLIYCRKQFQTPPLMLLPQ